MTVNGQNDQLNEASKLLYMRYVCVVLGINKYGSNNMCVDNKVCKVGWDYQLLGLFEADKSSLRCVIYGGCQIVCKCCVYNEVDKKVGFYEEM